MPRCSSRRSSGLLAHEGVQRSAASLHAVKEQVFYADLGGTRTVQQRVRVESDVRAIAIDADRGAFESMRTLAPPSGSGWEYVLGSGTPGWDWDGELAELPDLLAQKVSAPSVEPGPYTS